MYSLELHVFGKYGMVLHVIVFLWGKYKNVLPVPKKNLSTSSQMPVNQYSISFLHKTNGKHIDCRGNV